MVKAVSYARVSSVDQRDTGYSLDAQDSLFQEYARNKGINIVHAFQESESAKGRGRKTFQEMIAFVKKNKIGVLLFEKVDRMTRNFHDLIIIYDLIEKLELEVHLIKNSLILNKNSRSQEKFQLDIQVVLAKNYINNLSEEVKKGMAQKMASGGWAHLAPFGYRNSRINGVAITEPHPETMPIVKKIFEMSYRGDSVQTIASHVSDLLGKKHHASKIHYLLTNTFYIGEVKSKMGIFKGTHETFIPPTLFYSVQDRLKGRTRAINPQNRVFRFSGVLLCECGCKMQGELKKGKYVTYGCARRKKGEIKCTAVPRYISERVVMEQIDEILQKVTLTDEGYRRILEINREMFHLIDRESDTKADELNIAIRKKKARLVKLLDYYEDGILTREEYLEQKQELQMALAKNQAEYDAQTKTPLEYRTSFNSLFATLINLRSYLPLVEDPNDFQKIVRLIFSNLNLRAGKIDFSLTKLGEMILGLNTHTKWSG